jgi:hypothetical protein
VDVPPPARALSWLEEIADEERFVAANDLDALSLDHLRKLEADLSAKAQDLARMRSELGSQAESLLRKLDHHLVAIHALADAKEREKGGLLARWKK